MCALSWLLAPVTWTGVLLKGNRLAILPLSGRQTRKQRGSKRSCSLVISSEFSQADVEHVFSFGWWTRDLLWATPVGPTTPVPLDLNTFPYQVHICFSRFLPGLWRSGDAASPRLSVALPFGVTPEMTSLGRRHTDEGKLMYKHYLSLCTQLCYTPTHTPTDSCISLVLLNDRSSLERERRSNGVSALPEIPSAVCLRGGVPPPSRCEVVLTREAGEGTWGTHQRFISARRSASRTPRCFLHPIKRPVMWAVNVP